MTCFQQSQNQVHLAEKSMTVSCRQYIPHKSFFTTDIRGISKAVQPLICSSAVPHAHALGPMQKPDGSYLCPDSSYLTFRILGRLVLLQASGNLPPGSPNDLGLRLRALQAAHQPLVDLFNQYAVPYHQWELCLELVHASDGVDMAYVQQLWDLYLKQVSLMLLFHLALSSVLSCPNLSCLSCPVLSCPVLSCPVLSCGHLACTHML